MSSGSPAFSLGLPLEISCRNGSIGGFWWGVDPVVLPVSSLPKALPLLNNTYNALILAHCPPGSGPQPPVQGHFPPPSMQILHSRATSPQRADTPLQVLAHIPFLCSISTHTNTSYPSGSANAAFCSDPFPLLAGNDYLPFSKIPQSRVQPHLFWGT